MTFHNIIILITSVFNKNKYKYYYNIYYNIKVPHELTKKQVSV